MTRIARRGAAGAASMAALVVLALVPAAASAAESVPATVAPPASQVATPQTPGQWALDFTLPTFGKSGCLVCHSDPKLVVPKGGADVSYWVDEAAYNRSAHARVVCTGCHTDFGFKAPHTSTVDWKLTAKASCSACHEQQSRDVSDGAHAVRPTPDKRQDPKAGEKPQCGDCHGGHDIQKLKDNPAGQAAIHGTGQQMCGREACHADYWDNYDDYYHGRAYKQGAEDAPACWDCHGAHNVLKSTIRLAPTNEDNIEQTCGKGATGDLVCHEGAGAALASYVMLIHKKEDVLASNPIYSIFATVRSWFE